MTRPDLAAIGENVEMEANAALIAHAPTDLAALIAYARELEAENERLKKLVADHHDWHLNAGVIGLQDGDGGWIEIDNGAEYSDSSMYDRTEAALAGELRVMPRGGVNGNWRADAILTRRELKKAKAALATARAAGREEAARVADAMKAACEEEAADAGLNADERAASMRSAMSYGHAAAAIRALGDGE